MADLAVHNANKLTCQIVEKLTKYRDL